MKVTDHIIKAAGATQFTFEILPPLKGTKHTIDLRIHRPTDGVQPTLYRCNLPP